MNRSASSSPLLTMGALGAMMIFLGVFERAVLLAFQKISLHPAWADEFLYVTHNFRLPTLFLVFGFCAYHIFAKNGRNAYASAVLRIAVPIALTLVLSFAYGFQTNFVFVLRSLVIFVGVGWLLGLARPHLERAPNASWLLLAAMLPLVSLVLRLKMASPAVIETSGSIAIVYGLVFFISGGMLYRFFEITGHVLAPRWSLGLVGFALAYLLTVSVRAGGDPVAVVGASVLLTWAWVLGLVGIVQFAFRREKPWMHFAVNSSVWVYLIQGPLLILMMRLVPEPVPQILIGVGSTLVLGLVWYRYWVQNRWTGRALAMSQYLTEPKQPVAAPARPQLQLVRA